MYAPGIQDRALRYLDEVTTLNLHAAITSASKGIRALDHVDLAITAKFSPDSHRWTHSILVFRCDVCVLELAGRHLPLEEDVQFPERSASTFGQAEIRPDAAEKRRTSLSRQ